MFVQNVENAPLYNQKIYIGREEQYSSTILPNRGRTIIKIFFNFTKKYYILSPF